MANWFQYSIINNCNRWCKLRYDLVTHVSDWSPILGRRKPIVEVLNYFYGLKSWSWECLFCMKGQMKAVLKMEELKWTWHPNICYLIGRHSSTTTNKSWVWASWTNIKIWFFWMNLQNVASILICPWFWSWFGRERVWIWEILLHIDLLGWGHGK